MNALHLIRLARFTAASLALACVADVAAAQRVPFFFPGMTLFEPEISVVQSGALNDVQAVVSADRKYVTLNMRASNSTLLALRNFTFQNGRNGQNSGGANGQNPPAGAARMGGSARPANAASARGVRPASGEFNPVETSPAAIRHAAKNSILERPGMTRLDRAETVASPDGSGPREARDLPQNRD